MFGMITDTDFTSYSSIKSTRKLMEDYGKKNSKMNLV